MISERCVFGLHHKCPNAACDCRCHGRRPTQEEIEQAVKDSRVGRSSEAPWVPPADLRAIKNVRRGG